MTSASLTERADFRSLVDHLDGIAVWIVSEPGEFEYISAGFESIWGMPAEAVMNDVSRLVESIHPEDREQVRSQVEQSMAGEEVSEISYEARVVRPDGTVRWVQSRQFPLGGGNGDHPEIVGVSTDITEQKRREEELEALNRIVRHDIRNDMNILLGWARMLEEHTDADGEKHLRKILTAGDHVVELTEIARDYVETLTGNGELSVKPVRLDDVLQKEIDLSRESFPDAEISVSGDIPEVKVMANEMLQSVFKNLLNNAVQHNDNVQPLVDVSCELQDEAVVVRIADNGPGIPDDQKEAIFGRGEKGIDSSGTGIGLYLVETLVEQYKGDISVEDNTPTGSIFSVSLNQSD